MSNVQLVSVLKKDDDIRLDRWFARYYPALKNGALQRLLRGKNIRVNGAKATSNQHLSAGDEVRVPPLDAAPKDFAPRAVSAADTALMQSLVIYKDADVIVLNKPAGLAVQGGSKTTRHIDGMLDALRFDSDEKPRLVHRLDKETSGVLVLARTARAATALTKAFASHAARKVYWAVVVGRPELKDGRIDAPLAKMSGAGGGELVRVDYDNGQKANTLYQTIDALGKKAAWLALYPLTGRTHQLRVHCRLMGTPIVGDVKYGLPVGSEENPVACLGDNIKMHLHARGILVPHPNPKKGMLELYAALPEYMKNTFNFLGFDEKDAQHPFDCFKQE